MIRNKIFINRISYPKKKTQISHHWNEIEPQWCSVLWLKLLPRGEENKGMWTPRVFNHNFRGCRERQGECSTFNFRHWITTGDREHSHVNWPQRRMQSDIYDNKGLLYVWCIAPNPNQYAIYPSLVSYLFIE